MIVAAARHQQAEIPGQRTQPGPLRTVVVRVIDFDPAEAPGRQRHDHVVGNLVPGRARGGEGRDAAGDPGRYPDAGEPFAPAKLYYTLWSRRRIRALHDKYLELGLKSPYDDDRWRSRMEGEDRATTSIDIAGFVDVRAEALLAHATQIDPTSPFWFGLPPEAQRTAYPFDDYLLARSQVGPTDVDGEDDLFAGIG